MNTMPAGSHYNVHYVDQIFLLKITAIIFSSPAFVALPYHFYKNFMPFYQVKRPNHG